MGWQRWFNYYKAKVGSLVERADHDLDRREAELEVEKAEKPWLHTDRDTPTFEEARARIEHETRGTGERVPPTPSPPPGDAEAAERIAAFDLAKQQAAAEERLASIRESLDIEKPPPK